jgi:class 3 adenylate cyclase
VKTFVRGEGYPLGMATANATVMFTDIRGFTARTSRDSREGLEELLATHEALLLPVIRHYDGRVVKTIGDAFLVVFESPTNAVLCGVVIQHRLREFNRRAPEEKRIEVRVAINSGEVTLRGDDVFGEPVNICARIEGITEPNEVYFTEATYLTMQKAEVPSSEVGSRRLKGIPEEIRLYRVIQDEDNRLYRAILEHAEIAPEEAAAAIGSLSIPQWPPPRGRLQGPRTSFVPLLVATLVVAALVVGWLAFQSYREAHRYDATRASLDAKAWTKAQALAGELWGQRGDDQEAIRLLTEALTGEIAALEAAGDPAALQETWAARRLAWGNLPARDDLQRRVDRSRLAMAVERGDAANALGAIEDLHEADKADPDTARLLARALGKVLVVDFAAVKDQAALDAWQRRFEEHSKRHAGLPGFAAVRADASFGMGMRLAAAEDNFWKDAGVGLLRTFLQENEADRDRSFRARVRLVETGRWNAEPSQLGPYLEEDPRRAAEPGVKEAVLGALSRRYDAGDEEGAQARAMAWSTWGEALDGTLRAWLSGSANERLHAFRMLREAGRLSDAETDRLLAWVLLERTEADADLGLALDHWTGLLSADAAAARARAVAAVPAPLPAVPALSHGGTSLPGREGSAAEWRAVVAACFYDQVRDALLSAVATSAYGSERLAARAVLKARGALAPALASASYLAEVRQWLHDEPPYVPDDVREAVEHFAAADPAGLHDRAAVAEALREADAVAGDRLQDFETAGNLSGSERRQRTRVWQDFRDRIEAAARRVAP